MDDNTIGPRFKELREVKAKKLGRRKIPQREVAEALNISAGAYGSWESGRTRPDVASLPEIADYFEVSIDYLLRHTAEMQVRPERIITKTGIVWALRRAAQTENERKGIEIWRRLAQGESLETIATELKASIPLEIRRYLLDVIYADMIGIEQIPQDKGLAEQVRGAFGLREILVIITVPELTTQLRYILLGETARRYFKDHVQQGMSVGIAGGYSVSRMIYSLRRGECQNVDVYPLAVTPVFESTALDTNSLAGALAYRQHEYNVRGYCLQYASPEDLKAAGDTQKYALTQRILAKAKSVDIAFLGLGTLGRRRVPLDWLGDLLGSRGLSLEVVRERGAIGDILYHLIDRDGQPVSSEIDNLICSIGLEDLRQMVQWGVPVVAIASDRQKADIARAAIKGGYANVFIINDELARAMLDTEKS